ncbi:MAG: methylmalonyl Co-A mutase-associated GTPase MeaB [Flavobacteriales bacterium]|nr:methylmalonyl Co-A mutase-associated GTPase MeaB [Flavobacteriales bacterium]
MERPADAAQLFEAARAGDRVALARAITLLESSRVADRRLADELMRMALPYADHALRLGITGIPGVGKSTLIDALGRAAIKDGRRVAVLATDPSSARSNGSILGDKTRMELLSRSEHAFIRPTASGGHLGGVARRTRETAMLCAAVGFDLIMIETVGVGQSELEVDDMADLNLVLMIPGAGDELQGIKRGIMESADVVVLTKADGPTSAEHIGTRNGLKNSIAFLAPRDSGRLPDVLLTDALTGTGVQELWKHVIALHQNDLATGYFERRRQDQNVRWMHNAIREGLLESLLSAPAITQALAQLETDVRNGSRGPFEAASAVLELLRKGV